MTLGEHRAGQPQGPTEKGEAQDPRGPGLAAVPSEPVRWGEDLGSLVSREVAVSRGACWTTGVGGRCSRPDGYRSPTGANSKPICVQRGLWVVGGRPGLGHSRS